MSLYGPAEQLLAVTSAARWTWSRPATSTSPPRRYCHLVAGVVGGGLPDLRPALGADLAYAHKLGLAMQLTNIIRDVGDDAARPRIYLPVMSCSSLTSEWHGSCAPHGAIRTGSRP